MANKTAIAPSPAEPRAITVRFQRVTQDKLTKNRDHDLRRGPQPEWVDTDRGHLNRYLMPPPEPNTMRRRARELHALLGSGSKLYKNAATVISGVVAFGKTAQGDFLQLSSDQRDAAIMAVGRAVEKDTGCCLIGVVIHYDESAPHAHLTLEGRHAETGKPFTKVAHLPRLQTIAAETIQQFCPTIKRGAQRKGEPGLGPTYRTVMQMHKDMAAEIATMEAELKRLRDEKDELEDANNKFHAEQEQGRKLLQDAMDRAHELQRSLNERMQVIEAREAKLHKDRAQLNDAVQAQQANLNRNYARLTEFMQTFDSYVQDLLNQGIELPQAPQLPELDDEPDETPN